MKTYIIDYTRPDGRNDFKAVIATSPEAAITAFKEAGTDGWTGYQFSEYTITNVTER